jgi:fatty-acid peroxygenase
MAGAAGRRILEDELTVRLLRDRYRAVGRLRAEAGGPDWFGARMLGRRAVVVRGEAGARAFYDSALVSRRGAMPAPIRLVLFGPGAVHGLDGERHARRKQLLLDVVSAEAVDRLSGLVGRRLDEAVARWTARGSVTLFDELVEVYGGAVVEWAGTGTTGARARTVSRDLARIVDGFGVGGSAYPRAVLARARAQRWALEIVRDARSGVTRAPAGSAVATLAAAPAGELPDLVAATELLNVVRPTVAVAYFGAYAAQALARRPDWRPELAAGSPAHLRAFEHEVRRFYPFVPVLPGRLRRGWTWQGRRLPRRSWLVLDVLGTNRDPGLWEDPEEFRPERFLGREPTAYDYVPHGGGDPATGHRCPGEPIAVGILEQTLQRLAGLDFELGPPGREVALGRVPSLPADRVRLTGVRPASPAPGA